MASEFPVSPEQLKKLIKASRRIPVAFGYNPGTTDDDDEYLAAHLRKPPEVLGRIALHDGAGTKSAFGLFQIVGNELRLTCDRTIGQLAKRFKRYLRSHKIALNVVVLDAEGNVLESDVEELDEAFEADGDDVDPDDAPEAPEPEAQAEAPAGPDRAELVQRLRRLRDAIEALPPDQSARVTSGYEAAVALLRGGRADEAEAALGRLEAAVERLGREAPRSAPAAVPRAAPRAAPGAAPEPAPASAADSTAPVGRRLAAALDEAGGRIAGFDGPPAEALRDRLDEARGLLAAGDAGGALSALRRVQAGLRRAERARATWQAAARSIEAPLRAALARGAPPDLREAWEHASRLADSGAHERAVRALPPVAEALRGLRAVG